MITSFKNLLFITVIFYALPNYAESAKATVDVTLNPTGDFTVTSNKVTGHAQKTDDGFTAENIVVDLTGVQTKVALRDKHVKERLEVKKYPEAKLIKASGKNGKGQGVVEIKGKSHKVTGTYKVEGKMLVATFKLHLPDLGINDINYMGVGVEDDVVVHITVPFK